MIRNDQLTAKHIWYPKSYFNIFFVQKCFIRFFFFLPFVFFGVKLFFFFSLSSKDANSSSELDESSIPEGVKTLLGVSRDVGVLREGTIKGEAGSLGCELPTLSDNGAVLALALG